MLACMKCFSSLGAFIILVVGLAMTGITIYGFTHSQIFLNDATQRNKILGVMIAADILIVLGSIMGIYGLKKKNGLLICVFQIFVIIFLIVFFALGIAAEVLPNTFFGSDCSGSQNPTVALAASTQTKAISSFCMTGGCPCSLTDETVAKNYPLQQDRDWIVAKYLNRDKSGASAAQNCDVAQTNFTADQQNMAKALAAIEDLLGCSGWCDGTPQRNLIYRFTDVNKGAPTDGYCFGVLKTEIGKYANVIGIGSLLTAGFLFLVCIINTCICCHPSRKGLGMKNRFVYMKNGEYEKI